MEAMFKNLSSIKAPMQVLVQPSLWNDTFEKISLKI
jgi:hypothetical protein